MKTALRLTFLALLSLTFTGCGKKVPVPEKTVVAAYIDLVKAYENGKSLADAFIDALPEDDRRKAKIRFEKALKAIDTAKDALNPEWAVIAFGGTFKTLGSNQADSLAIAMKVNTGEDAVKKWVKKEYGAEIRSSKDKDNVIFEIFGEKRLALVDDTYLVFGLSNDAFEDMYDLYAGSAKPSEDFGDLAKISGDTVCRISTAPVSTLLKRFELDRYVEKFGEASEDKELADMILNMGAISLDIDAGEKVGLTLRVDCDSSGDAKLLESVAQSIAFFARIGCDAGAFLGDNPDVVELMKGPPRDAEEFKAAKAAFLAFARGVEADRSGSMVELSVLLEKGSIAKIIEAYTEYDEKRWKRFKDDYVTNNKYDSSSRDRARDLVRTVDLALARYRRMHGEYPHSLDALTRDDLLQGGTYDPWGRELRYERMGSSRPRVASAGPDGEFGTEDDIANMDETSRARDSREAIDKDTIKDLK